MDVSGLLQALGTVPPKKETLVPIEEEPAWATVVVLVLWEEENLLPFAGKEQSCLSCPALA